MIKNQVVFEIKKGDRNYQLLISSDSPLGELFDVLTEMRSYVVKRIEDASSAEKEKEKEQAA
jgi:hypothetical protein